MTSCHKDEDAKAVFTATIENSAKTSIDFDSDGKGVMSWQPYDQIALYVENESDFIMLTTSGEGATAVFEGGSEIEGDYYLAIYPASIARSSSTIHLTGIQEYDGSRLDAPMYAYSTSKNLAFRNLCGVFKITCSANNPIISIVLTADQPLAGDFELGFSDAAHTQPTMTLVNNGNASNTIVLSCNEAVDCSGANGGTFYMYLPYGSYTNMTLEVWDNNGNSCTKSLAAATIARNTFYTVPLNITFEDPNALPSAR